MYLFLCAERVRRYTGKHGMCIYGYSDSRVRVGVIKDCHILMIIMSDALHWSVEVSLESGLIC